MKKTLSFSKITVVISRQLSSRVVKALNETGVNWLYIETGRTSVLKQKTGLSLLSKKINLEYNPIEVISFYVQKKYEEAMLNYLYAEFDFKTPGRGTLISQNITVVKQYDLQKEDFELKIPERKKGTFFKDIKGLCCILQRGEENKVAKASLDMGTSVPITTYGEGSGVRDKLGLLRIAIPQGKSLLNLLVSTYDIEPIMELFITEGKLDEPGRGIAYVYDILHGVIDTKITSWKSGEIASFEQVVYALDAIKGGMEWRKSKFLNESHRKRPFLTDLVELNLVCDEGMGTIFSTAVIDHGIPGATISKIRYLSTDEDDKIPAAREICKMIISPKLISTVIEVVEEIESQGDEAHSYIYTLPVTKAFTYLSKKK